MTEGSVRERYGDFVAERIKEREQQQLDFYSNSISAGKYYQRGILILYLFKGYPTRI
jgi:hypothetical protein